MPFSFYLVPRMFHTLFRYWQALCVVRMSRSMCHLVLAVFSSKYFLRDDVSHEIHQSHFHQHSNSCRENVLLENVGGLPISLFFPFHKDSSSLGLRLCSFKVASWTWHSVGGCSCGAICFLLVSDACAAQYAGHGRSSCLIMTSS